MFPANPKGDSSIGPSLKKGSAPASPLICYRCLPTPTPLPPPGLLPATVSLTRAIPSLRSHPVKQQPSVSFSGSPANVSLAQNKRQHSCKARRQVSGPIISLFPSDCISYPPPTLQLQGFHFSFLSLPALGTILPQECLSQGLPYHFFSYLLHIYVHKLISE